MIQHYSRARRPLTVGFTSFYRSNSFKGKFITNARAHAREAK